jgi:hypothetical protein
MGDATKLRELLSQFQSGEMPYAPPHKEASTGGKIEVTHGDKTYSDSSPPTVEANADNLSGLLTEADREELQKLLEGLEAQQQRQ